MPIRVECACGKTHDVPDSAAGKAGRCRSCGTILHIPLVVKDVEPFAISDEELAQAIAARTGQSSRPTAAAPIPPPRPARPRPSTPAPPIVDVQDSPAADTPQSAPKGRTRFYRDPIILIGVAVPAAILISFGIYVYRDQAQKWMESEVRNAAAEGERLEKAGHVEEAYEFYRRATAIPKGRPIFDESTRDRFIEARAKAVKLFAKAKAARQEREAVEREAAQADAAQARQQEEIADEKDRIAKAARQFQEDQRRLSSITGTIAGSVYVSKTTGEAVVLKGHPMLLLPARIRRDKLDAMLQVVAGRDITDQTERDRTDRTSSLFRAIKASPPSAMIDMKDVFMMVRTSAPHYKGTAGWGRIMALARDNLFLEMVGRLGIAREFNTNIDGKYKLRISKVPTITYIPSLPIVHRSSRGSPR